MTMVSGRNTLRAPHVELQADQRAILDRGRTQGELAWNDVVEAIDNAAACLEEAGLWLRMHAPYADLGFEVPEYSWGGTNILTSAETAAIGDPCVEGESFYIEGAYANQPRAIEVREDYFDENLRGVMEECLSRHGVQVDAEATMLELNVIALGIVEEALEGIPNESGENNALIEEHNCLLQTYNEP